jgi:hypothetical protein
MREMVNAVFYVYGILFMATAQTLFTIGADPKHLGAKMPPNWSFSPRCNR